MLDFLLARRLRHAESGVVVFEIHTASLSSSAFRVHRSAFLFAFAFAFGSGFSFKVLVGAEIRERNQPTARGLAESLMRAAAVSKRALGEHVKTSMAQTDSGIYLGEIIGQTDLHIVQRLSTRTAVAHMKHLLDSVPAIGSEASIVYSHHAAAVRGIPSPEREKGLSR